MKYSKPSYLTYKNKSKYKKERIHTASVHLSSSAETTRTYSLVNHWWTLACVNSGRWETSQWKPQKNKAQENKSAFAWARPRLQRYVMYAAFIIWVHVQRVRGAGDSPNPSIGRGSEGETWGTVCRSLLDSSLEAEKGKEMNSKTKL